MGRHAATILGKRIGCYTVLRRVEPLPTLDPRHAHPRYRVRCITCGFEKEVCGQNLLRYPTMRCNHVPEGWRCIGPEDVALLETAREMGLGAALLGQREEAAE